jgi:hypothetical protein
MYDIFVTFKIFLCEHNDATTLPYTPYYFFKWSVNWFLLLLSSQSVQFSHVRLKNMPILLGQT